MTEKLTKNIGLEYGQAYLGQQWLDLTLDDIDFKVLRYFLNNNKIHSKSILFSAVATATRSTWWSTTRMTERARKRKKD